ncbi:flagellar hook-associated protein FlgK [Beijerinckia mobilis]|uniref:flagellar hook-associated protein FlgK n=1 Tax=Beijerinckia mobilis TaxID=231434 RepID=UPI000551B544|nr:flagellar hook-associated protein FlgK [Beijerinckia mobilis]
MSLTSAMNVTQSALSVFSAETSVTSRNIAGANSTGLYSRKSLGVVSSDNSGVETTGVTRAQDQALFTNLLTSTSESTKQSALSSGLDALYQTIGDTSSTTSPAALMDTFKNALQALSANPSDAVQAQSAVNAAKDLTSGLNKASTTVQSVREQADSEIKTSVDTINSILTQFQSLNTQIVSGSKSGTDVTDLLDSRDSLLQQLSQEVGITTTVNSDNSMSIFTDSGVTLFQDKARSVTFQPTSVYTAGNVGKNVMVDGVPITGDTSPMPIKSGKLAGLASLRDNIAPTYQNQLDQIAQSLIANFSETDQTGGTAPTLPGLFTYPNASGLPTSATGLAASIEVNANVDPSQGGSVSLLRDGGIASPGSVTYTYNTSSTSTSYTGRLNALVASFDATQTFSVASGLQNNQTVSDFATASVAWLNSQRQSSSTANDYQKTVLSSVTSALSNATGVNLDTEMSKMLALEQSYSASAKLMSTINTMFGTLLTAVG